MQIKIIPLAHIQGTGPELWEQTEGANYSFVSAMGTTGTIMGVGGVALKTQLFKLSGLSRLKAQIPGIRKWPRYQDLSNR